ncbi:XRE family transcriptional regulator [Rhodopirellula baltica SH28]|uniref:XRE family transcriptional regulator n=1 Tax=Rhodopirellula baltica SH28 TaxID=993517 RepID=K5CC69_RHOBT|nr:helix-turn-helix transcriptional regulator [Rhodopirellula baltica]EKK01090.1 XRE family transcriptional regulator [Rhodopirellula baltica SH28]
MVFGKHVRFYRLQRGWTQKNLAEQMEVSESYISKVECGRLHFGDYPSESFICKLAEKLMVDKDELLMLAGKVPLSIRERMQDHPALFRKLGAADDATLVSIEAFLSRGK